MNILLSSFGISQPFHHSTCLGWLPEVSKLLVDYLLKMPVVTAIGN